MHIFLMNSTSTHFFIRSHFIRNLVKPGHKLKVERETNKSSKSIDPYACAINKNHQFFDTWLTVRHILSEISHHCYFLEGGNITGHLISTTYKVFPVPSGGLEAPLLLTFSIKSEKMFKLMKSFFNDLYDYAYTGQQAENNDEESGNNEEIDITLTGEENATNENTKMLLK